MSLATVPVGAKDSSAPIGGAGATAPTPRTSRNGGLTRALLRRLGH